MFLDLALSLALSANPATDLSLLGAEAALDLGRHGKQVVKQRLVQRDRVVVQKQRNVVVQQQVIRQNVIQRDVVVQRNVLRASAYPVFAASAAVYHAPAIQAQVYAPAVQLQAQVYAAPVAAAVQVQQYLALPVQSFAVPVYAPVYAPRAIAPVCY